MKTAEIVIPSVVIGLIWMICTGAMIFRYGDIARWRECNRAPAAMLGMFIFPITFIIFSMLWIGRWPERPKYHKWRQRKYQNG